MPKWKKDETEYKVRVNEHKTRGFQSTIPKPIMERLGTPKAIVFLVKGRRIEVVSGESPSGGYSHNE